MTKWWLVTLDVHGNPTLVDGSHDEESNAHAAYHLHKRLGLLRKDAKYAVIEVKTIPLNMTPPPLNEEAIAQCAKMGLHE